MFAGIKPQVNRTTPASQELLALSEHLFYEVQMTFSLATFLAEAQGAVSNQISRNAEIEAFTIHVRQLIDFLWKIARNAPRAPMRSPLITSRQATGRRSDQSAPRS
jgi:hypothetical protein